MSFVPDDIFGDVFDDVFLGHPRFISPYRSDRDNVRSLLAQDDFLEVYVNTPLQVCEQRDPKGLYKKARSGEIPNFTGISDPYEAPLSPELELRTADLTVEAAAQEVLDLLALRGKIPAHTSGETA